MTSINAANRSTPKTDAAKAHKPDQPPKTITRNKLEGNRNAITYTQGAQPDGILTNMMTAVQQAEANAHKSQSKPAEAGKAVPNNPTTDMATLNSPKHLKQLIDNYNKNPNAKVTELAKTVGQLVQAHAKSNTLYQTNQRTFLKGSKLLIPLKNHTKLHITTKDHHHRAISPNQTLERDSVDIALTQGNGKQERLIAETALFTHQHSANKSVTIKPINTTLWRNAASIDEPTAVWGRSNTYGSRDQDLTDYGPFLSNLVRKA